MGHRVPDKEINIWINKFIPWPLDLTTDVACLSP